jgi:hypothetical protein
VPQNPFGQYGENRLFLPLPGIESQLLVRRARILKVILPAVLHLQTLTEAKYESTTKFSPLNAKGSEN